MLRGPIIHPTLLEALARCGHGSEIVIVDALYPSVTHVNPAADRVELNLTPGTVPAATILELVGQSLQIEKATYMRDADGGVSEPVAEFQELLEGHTHHGGDAVEWDSLERFDFYSAARGEDVSLVIVSGEVRPYACLMLTVGVP